MPWKKYTKKLEEIQKANMKIDKEMGERFDQLVDELGGTDEGVQLEFLKDYLNLSPEDEDALKELSFMIKSVEDYIIKVVVDKGENEEYIYFPKQEPEEEE
ncbi:phage gp6-like head-tail connector protein [Candidatus Thorarchaeota archaeon]|nr:MAG: phage gp6-like head-tail connector protein [Candidatus Thorarchaeota archaeon]